MHQRKLSMNLAVFAELQDTQYHNCDTVKVTHSWLSFRSFWQALIWAMVVWNHSVWLLVCGRDHLLSKYLRKPTAEPCQSWQLRSAFISHTIVILPHCEYDHCEGAPYAPASHTHSGRDHSITNWFMKEECLAWPTNIGQTIHTPVHAFRGDSYFIFALFNILQRPACAWLFMIPGLQKSVAPLYIVLLCNINLNSFLRSGLKSYTYRHTQ